MAGSEDLIIRFKADLDEIKRGLKSVKSDASKVGDELESGFGKATSALGPMKAALGAVAAIGAGAIIASEFKQAVVELTNFNLKIAEINTLLPATNRVTKETTKAIKNLSVAFGKDKSDLAAAYYDVISAGSTDAAKSLELLETATKASIVGVTDVKTATGAILSVLNAYGEENLSASEAANKLFTVVQKGRTTFPELAGSIGDVVPLAASLGVNLDELGGILAVSTRISGNTAKSVTQLTAAFSNILKPSEESQKVISKLNKELGTSLEFSALALKDKGIEKFLGDIFKATEQFSDQEQILSKLFGSTRAVRGILAITGDNFRETSEAIKAVNTQTDTLDLGFITISDTLSAKFDKAVQVSKNGLDKFAELAEPLIISLIDKFTAAATAAGIFFDMFMEDKTTAMAENLVMLKDEAIDPLSQSINGMFTELMGDEEEEGPFAKMAREANEAAKANDNLGKSLKKNTKPLLDNKNNVDKNKDANEKLKKSFEALNKSANTQIQQGMAKAISMGIQFVVNSMASGEFASKKFTAGILNLFGDMAIRIGEQAIATGLTMLALVKMNATGAIAAGAGLIAIGSIIKAYAAKNGGGSGGGPVSSIPSPVAPAGAESVPTISSSPLNESVDETLEENTEDVTAIQREQRVQVVVQGDVLDSEETGLRLVEILNNEFESSNGRLVTA